MKKLALVFLPVVALILEILPYGAVLVYSPSPAEEIIETYSYFSLTPLGYANVGPFLTAFSTCVILIVGILALIKGSRKLHIMHFFMALIAVADSLMPLMFGLDYYPVPAVVITVLLALEAFVSFLFVKEKRA